MKQGNVVTIGCLAPETSYGAKAAAQCRRYLMEVCGVRQVDVIYLKTTNKGVFQAVQNGVVDYVVVPFYNSIDGSITYWRKILYMCNGNNEAPFMVCGVTAVKVNHCLLTRPNVKLSKIKSIVSHNAAVGQCSEEIEWRVNRYGVTVHEVNSTGLAAKMVAEEDEHAFSAAIATRSAVKHGLVVRKRNIHDGAKNGSENVTRFALIKKPGAPDHFSTLFVNSARTMIGLFLHDVTGALINAGSILKHNNWKMLPSIDSGHEKYFFLIECDDRQTNRHGMILQRQVSMSRLLKKLEQHEDVAKVLKFGVSYPLM